MILEHGRQIFNALLIGSGFGLMNTLLWIDTSTGNRQVAFIVVLLLYTLGAIGMRNNGNRNKRAEQDT